MIVSLMVMSFIIGYVNHFFQGVFSPSPPPSFISTMVFYLSLPIADKSNDSGTVNRLLDLDRIFKRSFLSFHLCDVRVWKKLNTWSFHC